MSSTSVGSFQTGQPSSFLFVISYIGIWVCEKTERLFLNTIKGTASLLERMDRPETTVAIDGSLFKHHPRLKSFMEKYIAAMAPANKFQLMLAEDGSGKGAGLIAAIASRLKKQQAH